MGNAIDVRRDTDTTNENNHYAQLPEVVVTSYKLNSLVDILSLYGELGAEGRESVSRVKQRSIELKKNQKLYSLSAGVDEIFIVKSGWVSLCHSVSRRGQDICNVYMPGDIVGVRESFFDNYDISILALENCILDKVVVSDFHAVFRDSSEVKRAVVSYIMVNDNIAIERLRSCTHHKAEERVAHFLLEIFERYNFKKMLDSNSYHFPITQEVVGELLGITSVHVSRCMTSLEQKKLIRKSRNAIKLLQPELMLEKTGFDKDLIYGHLNIFD